MTPTSGFGFVDWRGLRAPKYAPAVEQRLDHATGLPVCVECEGSLEGRTARARFCDHDCRSRYHARQARRRGGTRRATADVEPVVAPTVEPRCTPRAGMWDGHPRRDICTVHGGPLRRRRGRWVHG